jgi:hypothetical protein
MNRESVPKRMRRNRLTDAREPARFLAGEFDGASVDRFSGYLAFEKPALRWTPLSRPFWARNKLSSAGQGLSLGGQASPRPVCRSHGLPTRYCFPSLSSQLDLIGRLGRCQGRAVFARRSEPLTPSQPSKNVPGKRREEDASRRLASIARLPPLAPIARLPPLAPIARLSPLAPIARLSPLAPIARLSPLAPIARLPPLASIARLSPLASIARSILYFTPPSRSPPASGSRGSGANVHGCKTGSSR